MKTPNQTKTIKILQNEYTLNYPDTGGIIDIAATIDRISNGTYNSLIKTETFLAINARSTIEMVATFSVLIPKLKEDLKVASIFKLPAIQNKELVKVYLQDVAPWMLEWDRFLNGYEEEVEEKKNDL